MAGAVKRRRKSSVSSDESYKAEQDELASDGGSVSSGTSSAQRPQSRPRQPRASTSGGANATSGTNGAEGDADDDAEDDAVTKRKVRLFYAARPSRARIGALRKLAAQRREAYKSALSNEEEKVNIAQNRVTDRRFRVFQNDTSLRWEFSKDLHLVHESNEWLKLWREHFEWDHKWPRFSTLVGVACRLYDDNQWPTEKEFDVALDPNKKRKQKKNSIKTEHTDPNALGDIAVLHVSGHQLPLISNTVDTFLKTGNLFITITRSDLDQDRLNLYFSFGAKILGRKYLITTTANNFEPQEEGPELEAFKALCRFFEDNPMGVTHGTVEALPDEFQLNLDDFGYFAMKGLAKQSKTKLKWSLGALEHIMAPLRDKPGVDVLKKCADGRWRMDRQMSPKRSSVLYPLQANYENLARQKKEYKPQGTAPPPNLPIVDPNLPAGVPEGEETERQQSQPAAETAAEGDDPAPTSDAAEGSSAPKEAASTKVARGAKTSAAPAAKKRRISNGTATSEPQADGVSADAHDEKQSTEQRSTPARRAAKNKAVDYADDGDGDVPMDGAEDDASNKVADAEEDATATTEQPTVETKAPLRGRKVVGARRKSGGSTAASTPSSKIGAGPKVRATPGSKTKSATPANKSTTTTSTSSRSRSKPMKSKGAFNEGSAPVEAPPTTTDSIEKDTTMDEPAPTGFAPPPPASFFKTNSILTPFKTSSTTRPRGSMVIDFETGQPIDGAPAEVGSKKAE
ncbi:hypothetical protein OIO90_005600 [Microbotryomycetes sp. JL221]|nr:hypothetical protein OIO90_005600 [Microbotryomycetes sp. JL221]